jgi:hypothetical protein
MYKVVENTCFRGRCQTRAIAPRNHLAMKLQYAAQGAIRAQRAREQMRRRGRTPNGHPLWTPREDAVVIALHPDYRALRRALRRRTLSALWHRARTLRVARRNHVWLITEEQRLRRLFSKADRNEILAAFPELCWTQIVSKAKRMRLRRPRRRPAATGHTIIDAIRERAFVEGWSMADLDAAARTKSYFRRAAGRRHAPNGKAILRAIAALGGEVEVRWL